MKNKYPLIEAGKNLFLYRGFTIRKAPRNNIIKCATYLINQRDDSNSYDNYLGRDFALAEAMRTVDHMLKAGGSHAR
ncbi:hypothetical protein ACFX4S_14230 [Kosakonia sp. YIM B13605]|uniref:hypothetical protein n=1 Tax=Kosakonia TaxID=1330547 RepID=UPI0032D8D1EF